MFIRFDRIYERDRHTGGQTDGQTPHDGKAALDASIARQKNQMGLVHWKRIKVRWTRFSDIMFSCLCLRIWPCRVMHNNKKKNNKRYKITCKLHETVNKDSETISCLSNRKGSFNHTRKPTIFIPF